MNGKLSAVGEKSLKRDKVRYFVGLAYQEGKDIVCLDSL
jgi:hypothetical protein